MTPQAPAWAYDAQLTYTDRSADNCVMERETKTAASRFVDISDR
jgi:hypothetical protein